MASKIQDGESANWSPPRRRGWLFELSRPAARAVRALVFRLAYAYFSATVDMDPTAVLMLSDTKLTTQGNLLPIRDALAGTPMHAIVIDKPSKRHRRGVKISLGILRTIASCKYVLLEDHSPLVHEITPRPGQEFIQTWHASGAFKRIGHSRLLIGESPGRIFHRNYAFAIVGGEANRAPYAEGFGMPIERVLATGLPRTDRFFDPDYVAATRSRIFAEHPAIVGKRVVLFAPTFRGMNSVEAYYDWDRLDFDGLAKTLGDECVFLIKPHPYSAHNLDRPEQAVYRELVQGAIARHPGLFLDFSAFPDVNDLLLVTDVLVTDYSSIVFELSLLDKPVVFFAYDYDEYTAHRGFYFDFSEYTYGPVVRTSAELGDAIVSAGVDEPRLAVFRERFTAACDGHAARRFVETFFADELGTGPAGAAGARLTSR